MSKSSKAGVHYRLPEPLDGDDPQSDFSAQWYRQLSRQYDTSWLCFVIQMLLSEAVKRGDLLITADCYSKHSTDLHSSGRMKRDWGGIDHGVGFVAKSDRWSVEVITNHTRIKDKCPGQIKEGLDKSSDVRYKCDTCEWSNRWPTLFHFPEPMEQNK